MEEAVSCARSPLRTEPNIWCSSAAERKLDSWSGAGERRPCGVEGAVWSFFFSQSLPQEVAFVPEHPGSLLGARIRRSVDLRVPLQGYPRSGPRWPPRPWASASAEVISTASFFSAQRAQPGLTLSLSTALSVRGAGGRTNTPLKKKKKKICLFIYCALVSWWCWPSLCLRPRKGCWCRLFKQRLVHISPVFHHKSRHTFFLISRIEERPQLWCEISCHYYWSTTDLYNRVSYL